MRIIIGAPKTTRIVEIKTELNLLSVYERILYINTAVSIKSIGEYLYFTELKRQLKHRVIELSLNDNINLYSNP